MPTLPVSSSGLNPNAAPWGAVTNALQPKSEGPVPAAFPATTALHPQWRQFPSGVPFAWVPVWMPVPLGVPAAVHGVGTLALRGRSLTDSTALQPSQTVTEILIRNHARAAKFYFHQILDRHSCNNNTTEERIESIIGVFTETNPFRLRWKELTQSEKDVLSRRPLPQLDMSSIYSSNEPFSVETVCQVGLYAHIRCQLVRMGRSALSSNKDIELSEWRWKWDLLEGKMKENEAVCRWVLASAETQRHLDSTNSDDKDLFATLMKCATDIMPLAELLDWYQHFHDRGLTSIPTYDMLLRAAQRACQRPVASVEQIGRVFTMKPQGKLDSGCKAIEWSLNELLPQSSGY